MATVADPIVPTSAGPMLSLLEESEPELQAHALRSLDALSHAFWPEISSAVPRILELSEDLEFSGRNLAALVASKVFFHLGELDEALKYALAAGELFQVGEEEEFAGTLRSKCIDEYVRVRTERDRTDREANKDGSYEKELEAVVDRLLDGCIAKGEIKEAIGVALEARRLDRVEEAVLKGCKSLDERSDALAYCFNCAQSLVAARGYRTEVVKLIGQLYAKEEDRDEVAIASCMAYVQDAEGVAKALARLVGSGGSEEEEDDRELVALQVAFDIVDNDEPHFASEVSNLLANRLQEKESAEQGEEVIQGESRHEPNGIIADEKDKGTERIKKLQHVLNGSISSGLFLDFLCRHNHSDLKALSRMQTSLDPRSSVCHSALVFANACAHAGTAVDGFLRENLEWLSRATAWAKFSATGGMGTIHARHWQAALNILSPYLPSSATIGVTPTSASFSQGGALYALGLITACTGTDGNMKARKHIMDLLKENAEGAASQQNEVVMHGACLGLGLSAMATHDGSTDHVDDSEEYGGRAVYAELKERLMGDSAAGGEAAGLAMGLVSLGSGVDIVWQELLSYARETQHEKITRGAVMGISLVMYGRENESEACIEELISDKNSIIRYGACYTIGLAYCATGHNGAIRKLLHLAVSDVADEVRRAAIIALGFVMLRQPEQVPEIVALLSESCHDHARYGSAIAIGIACVGSGLSSAVKILNRLITDSVDFVRQGAYIALAMVYMHHNEIRSPEVVKFRQTLEKTVGDKHEDIMARFGASIAIGLIDLGGKNAILGLISGGRNGKGGSRRMRGIVGMVLFTQMWYWYPFIHFISLAARPAGIIGIDKSLKMVECELSCEESKEGIFDYVKNGLGGPGDKKKAPARALTAVLSVTAKSKAREAAKKKAGGAKDTKNTKDTKDTRDTKNATDTKDIIMADGATEKPTEEKRPKTRKPAKRDEDGDVVMEDTSEPKRKDSNYMEIEKKDEEKTSDKDGGAMPNGVHEEEKKYKKILSNPCRVLPGQETCISWEVEGKAQRYQPIKRGAVTGIIMLKDLRKGEPQRYIERKILDGEEAPAPGGNVDTDEDEVVPPEPFEYTDETEEVTDASQKANIEQDSNNINNSRNGAGGNGASG